MNLIAVAAVLLGQCSSHAGYGGGYAYTPSHNNYSYGQSYGYNTTYAAPYVQAKLTVVATEQPYGYGSLLGESARYELKAKEEQDFRKELLAKLEALASRPAPAPEVQTFQAPQPQFQYAPAPSPQQPVQPAPQQPQYVPQQPYAPPPQPYAPQAPQKSTPPTPGKSFNPAPLPPQVPAPNPATGDWGAPAAARDGEQVVMSIFGRNCVECHNAGNPSGGIVLADAEGNPISPLRLSFQQLRKIDKAVSSGKMPRQIPGVEPMQPNERAVLEDGIVSLYAQARR